MAELYDETWNLLAAQLTAIAYLRDQASREQVLGLLRSRNYDLGVEATDEANLDCLSIAGAMLNQAGAPEALAWILVFATDSAQTAVQFAAEVDMRIASGFLSFKDHCDLHSVLEKVLQSQQLADYYRLATGDRVAPRKFVDTDDLMRELEELKPHGFHPLIRLTETARQRTRSPLLRMRLLRWSDDLAAKLDRAASEPHRGDQRRLLGELRSRGKKDREQDPDRASEPAVLAVQLTPSGPNHERYSFAASLFAGDEFVEQIHVSDQPEAMDELNKVFVAALNKALVRAGTTEIVLEFILPRNLMCYPIEQKWRTSEEPHTSLDVLFVLVIRDLYRHKTPAAAVPWKRKWEQFTKNGQSFDDLEPLWVTCSDDQVSAGAGYYQMINDDRWAWLGLTFPPRPDLHKFMIGEVLDAGVPIAVWPHSCQHSIGAEAREKGEGEVFQRKLTAQLEGRSLKELPGIVRNLRRDQQAKGVPQGGVTLLWDDPGRCIAPEDFGLDVPQA